MAVDALLSAVDDIYFTTNCPANVEETIKFLLSFWDITKGK